MVLRACWYRSAFLTVLGLACPLLAAAAPGLPPCDSPLSSLRSLSSDTIAACRLDPMDAPGPLALTSPLDRPVRALRTDPLVQAAEGARPAPAPRADLVAWRVGEEPVLRLPRVALAARASGRVVVLGAEALALYALLRPGDQGEEEPETGLDPEISGRFTLASARASATAGAPAGWRSEGGTVRAGAAPTAEPAAVTAVTAARGERLRAVMNLARRMSGVVDAFRGLNLNSFALSSDTRVKLTARTGRHARVLFILSHRF